ncbi:hypothetical protein BDC45DRAFT_572991 [Circinella umbellata]|nr:hypothetical protein BDC45DRAFT_572991 [Circinella umbellata]
MSCLKQIFWRKKLKYLSINGISSIGLKEHCHLWRINTTSITERFLQFRSDTIERAKDSVLDTYQQELALNCIFLIDDLECVPGSRLRYGFDQEEWDCMVEEVKDLYPIKSLNDDLTSLILQFARAGDEDFNSCKKIIKAMPIDAADDNLCIEFSMNRISFSIDAVHPVLLPFIDETELTTRYGTDSQAQESEELVVLKKIPLAANEMKDVIDNMVNDGVDDENVTVLGVLIEGARYS